MTLNTAESRSRKDEPDRMAAMLSRPGGRGYRVQEEQAIFGARCGSAIAIAIAIAIWKEETRSPNQTLQATLDSTPECRQMHTNRHTYSHYRMQKPRRKGESHIFAVE